MVALQVDGAALIWDISGLLEVGEKKMEDHVTAFKLPCERECATSFSQSKLHGPV